MQCNSDERGTKVLKVVNEPTTDCTIQFGSAKRNGDIDWNITESGKTLAPIILNATIFIYVGHKSERKQSEDENINYKTNRYEQETEN